MPLTTPNGPVYLPLNQNWVYPFAIPAGSDPRTQLAKQFNRKDQGVDLQNLDNGGINPVYAACSGTVDWAKDTGPGGGFGPAYPIVMFDKQLDIGLGKNNMADGIYYGHILRAQGLSLGQKINGGDLIGNTTCPSQGNAAPACGWLEIGYWNNSRGPVNSGSGEGTTPAGQQMYADLYGAQAAGVDPGAPAGVGGLDANLGAITGSGAGTTSTENFAADAQAVADYLANLHAANLDDPRNNLPFSPMFAGLVMGTDYTTGSFRTSSNTPVLTTSRPITNLVRGGMVEQIGQRPGGPFACYFMINPDSIAYANSINSSIAPPTTNSAATNDAATWLMTSQSISFTIYFNRQYEVWTNDVPPTLVSPGPSAIGVRYDIRALERLLGMYDGKNLIGNGVNSPSLAMAQATPLQVAFGGPNSIQFQGKMTEMDYTYTKFDKNMIPVQAQVDITMMRIINPPANDLMINTLIQPMPPSIASPLLPAQVQFRNVGTLANPVYAAST